LCLVSELQEQPLLGREPMTNFSGLWLSFL
jgi:hypothetical protein